MAVTLQRVFALSKDQVIRLLTTVGRTESRNLGYDRGVLAILYYNQNQNSENIKTTRQY